MIEEWRECIRWTPDNMRFTTDAVVVVSNKGRVKCLEHKRWNKKNNSYSNIKEKEYAYLTNRGKQRYEKFDIEKGLYTHVDIKGKAYSLHRLVATAFIPNPENLPQVHHKDENRSNNCVSNLQWVTNSENQKLKSPETCKKKRLKMLRFSDKDVRRALEMRLEGHSNGDIGKMFNVSHETIRARTNEIATDEQIDKIKKISIELTKQKRLKTLKNRKIIS